MKLSKIAKILSPQIIEELDALDEAAIKSGIATSEEAIASATRERDANSDYKAAKQAVKDLSESLRDLKKFQSARIHYGLIRLRILSGEDVGDDE